MARLVYGMMVSLDGYISGPDTGPHLPMPDADLHRHFNAHMRGITGSLYGRRMYELMRYWDTDEPGQDEIGRDFGAAWRAQPKWVVSRTLKAAGPNATIVEGDLETFVQTLKTGHDGEIDVAGAELAGHLTSLGLIDEYRLYISPVVLGGGKPFFAAARPPLSLAGSERFGDTILLRYLPA